MYKAFRYLIVTLVGSDPFLPDAPKIKKIVPCTGENPMGLSLEIAGDLVTYTACGHAGTRSFAFVTEGEYGDRFAYDVPDHLVDRFCRVSGFECPECFFVHVAAYAIPCVICSRPIFPGDKVVFWPIAPVSEYASHEGFALGCMLMGCATGYCESAGVWTSTGVDTSREMVMIS